MKIAVYTTCHNQLDLVKSFLSGIPDTVGVFITDLASTDGSFQLLQSEGVNVFQAQFDPVSQCKALNFTLSQITDDYDFCLNLNLGETFDSSLFELLYELVDKDGAYINTLTFDEEGVPDYCIKELRFHKNTKDWCWHYSYEPLLFPRTSVDLEMAAPLNVGAYDEELAQDSLELAEESYSLYKDSYSALMFADTCTALGQQSKAMEMYLKTIELNSSKEHIAKANCSLAYANRGSLPDISYLLKYHALDYNCVSSHLEMARYYYSKRWYNSALGYVESGLALVQSDIKTDNLSTELGCFWKLLDIASYCSLELGRTADFQQYLLKACQANPKSKRIAANVYKYFRKNGLDDIKK